MRTVAVVIAAATLLEGCSPPPVEWQDPTALPAALAASPALTFDSAGHLAPTTPPVTRAPAAPGQCAGSIRFAHQAGGPWYVAWWSLRADSTADLVVAYSADGSTWQPPVKVDTLDTAPTGCRRLAPSIAADGGNVHLAYAMAAKEGPGIFASHSMDRGTMFHSPVPVVYGERIGETAIAARGNTVAVAYEDPNGAQDRIGVALSRTMAHLFEYRFTVSPAADSARRPGVALGNGTIAVTWALGSDTVSRMLRMGVLR